ncbi:MAG: type II toxin-antitoxin system PrlF family antitoxin [Sideroxydans sp.]|jgi:antitoxin PrlF
MQNTLQFESTLTDRYQTTVPETVRHVLRLGKRDKIHYVIQPDGAVLMTRSVLSEDDPLVGNFLDFLALDMKEHPDHIQMIDAGLADRIRSLVGHVEVDLDAPLPADNE